MRRGGKALRTDSTGAVAPLVGLVLIALLASAGLAFDYARMVALDTELQDAADQAALAAATQLDGQTGACARAAAAASSLVSNLALMDNNSGTQAITVTNDPGCDVTGSIRFYQSYNQTTDTPGAAATSDANARVVILDVMAKRAAYALTPIVRLYKSPTMSAEAVASVGSAICREPPLMMCNPNSDAAVFDVSNYVGKGILLKATTGSGAYAPGDFGFLDVGAGGSDLKKLIGYGSPPDTCVDVTQPSTETGSIMSTIDQFNTRFDIYESGDSINCYSQDLCPPAVNSRKDVILENGTTPSKNNCGIASGAGSKGWIFSSSPYRPTTKAVLPTTTTPDAMGYPRDQCHAHGDPTNVANQDCGTSSWRFGTGAWDRDAYFRSNYGWTPSQWQANTSLTASATRYQVYQWEMAQRGNSVGGKTVLGSVALSGQGTDYGQPICKPSLTGSVPGGSVPDRRILPVAVVNCTGLSGGKKPVNPIDWIDVFLVEPSIDRSGPSGVYTQTGDIYVEVIGHTSTGSGGASNQVVRHDKPYLIK